MNTKISDVQNTRKNPYDYFNSIGNIFNIFDEKTQDSGNVSFCINIDGENYFIKTAGPVKTLFNMTHKERVLRIENAYEISQSVIHKLLPACYAKISSSWGPVLVYKWAEGELIHTPANERDLPNSPYKKMFSLEVKDIINFLTQLIDLHHLLTASGWIANDLYDGCLIYNFKNNKTHIIDLDHYHKGSFTNKVGRLFGSSRFMAPEEFKKGEVIDERTTVFNVGRFCDIFLYRIYKEQIPGDLHNVIEKSISENPDDRYQSFSLFKKEWMQIIETV